MWGSWRRSTAPQRAVRKSRLLTKLFAVMFLLWLLQLATNFAIVYAAVNVRGLKLNFVAPASRRSAPVHQGERRKRNGDDHQRRAVGHPSGLRR